MPHSFYELYNLMPKLDCGLCGNPSCQTMTRKIAVRDSEPEECLPLYANSELKKNTQKIKALVREGTEIRATGTIVNEETGFAYIHPCTTEADKVTAETKLMSSLETAANLKYGFFDPLQICVILNTTDVFQNAKCSPSLGIGRAHVNSKTVLISKNGKINVRQAKDKEDAQYTIRQVARALWSATICTCGNASVDCASGGCEQCQTQVCPVMKGGPPDPVVERQHLTQATTVPAIFDRVKTLKTRGYFEEGMMQLDEAFRLFNQTNFRSSMEHSANDSLLKLAEDKIAQANKLAIQFTVETSNVHDAYIGLILSGLAMDSTRIVNGLKRLTSISSEISALMLAHLLPEAMAVATDAYYNIRTADSKKAKQVRARYEEFKERWMEAFRSTPQENLLIAIEKIAVNGFYISRLLTRPLPM
ncbi:MAG: hypothetical protein JSW29_05195 [Candidatus Bathyarchaeota archaeon]|nr:MAG: hypothetical protein JSW29_05195 [Candidatus Bathyarchaeota archaeon]